MAGTLVLMLPMAKTGPGGAGFLEALFTATSAVCVTGLAVVDTATYWTPFGQVAILVMIQLGGFGIMSFASLLGVLMARRLGLKSRIQAAAETKSTGFGDVRSVLLGVLRITVATELVVALALALRFALGLGNPWGHSLWLGFFHSVSAFNNAGFALFTDNLMGFVGDPWICLPIAAAIIVGGLGFPVLFELGRHYRKPLHWTMNTKLVIYGTVGLLAAGTMFICALEWSNPKTL
ncbi:potassium transporter TrkG, partial [Paeniglutamicibacter sp.]|uniref:potassium transporter TrkG n=1 Tax=Paeniglutamicibacter sp. TaxID=1934391 RepID=UPI00398A066C